MASDLGRPVTWDRQSLIIDGHRVCPVMGEVHYSRIPADEWQAHYQLGKVDEEFTLSYTRCGLCELARKRGHLDILLAMCRTDYITFEAMGAILHRNKTLASGDDCCLYYIQSLVLRRNTDVRMSIQMGHS